MKGKPFLVAVAAFVIVLFGGVAIAGVGTLRNDPVDEGTETAAHVVSGPVNDEPTKDEPSRDEPTETVEDHGSNKDEEKSEPAPEKVKDEESEDKEADAVKDDETVKDGEEAEEKDHEEEAPVDLFSITEPTDGDHFERKVVRFGGDVADGVTVHRGKYTAKVVDGKWSMELVLAPGRNKVAFEAVDAKGNIHAAAVTVYYDAPKEEEQPKEEEPKEEEESKDVKFTANQKYGSCGEEVPYDVFWGTTKPGATIKASSEYGSGSTVANEKGHWELKVTFPTSPPGKTFNVRITSSAGGSQTFTFTNTGGGGDH
jgi:hypothetical protein